MSEITIGNKIQRFFEQTSVRGVVWALRRNLSKVLRGIWRAAIIDSLSITAWQLKNCGRQLQLIQSNTWLSEALHKSVFSWVTVCNDSPTTDGTFVYNLIQFAKTVDATKTVLELVSASFLSQQGITHVCQIV